MAIGMEPPIPGMPLDVIGISIWGMGMFMFIAVPSIPCTHMDQDVHSSYKLVAASSFFMIELSRQEKPCCHSFQKKTKDLCRAATGINLAASAVGSHHRGRAGSRGRRTLSRGWQFCQVLLHLSDFLCL